MPVFRCSECGNTVEEEAPPEKCPCGAKFSFDEVFDYANESDDSEEDDEDTLEPDDDEDETY